MTIRAVSPELPDFETVAPMTDAAAFAENCRRNGFAGPVRIVPPEYSGALKAMFDAYEAQSRAVRGRPSHIKPHLVDPLFARLALAPAALAAVRTVLGPDILLWSTGFFIKAAGAGRFVSWHQDAWDWGLTPHLGIATLWLALTPSTVESGAVRFVRGSHTRGLVRHEETLGADNILSLGQSIPVDEDADDIADAELQPGEASLHNGLAIHGGGPNRSSWDRVGLTMTYIRADAVQHKGRDLVTAIDGCRPDRFDYESLPAERFGPAEIAMLEEALRRPSGFGDMTVK